jgi:hypothetical protein
VIRHRVRGRAVATLTLLLAVALPGGSAFAASPDGSSVAAAGFARTSEVMVRPGWAIDTYTSSKGTVRTFGRAGSSASVPSAAARAGFGSSEFSLTSPDLKKDLTAAAGQQNSAVGALIALGVDPQVALREFGGLDTLDGSTPASDQALASAQGPTVSFASYRAPSPEAAPTSGVAVSTTVPYDTQCATIDTQNHRVQGYGCSTLYVVWANGSDWFFANKYKLSAQSTSTSLFPLRLRSVAWRLSFAANNNLYDWDPSGSQSIGSCFTVTIGSQGDPAHGGFGISIAAQICPDSIGAWGPINATQSGAIWNGAESGTAFEAAIGTQELHSPANASASHNSTYSITFSCGLDC